MNDISERSRTFEQNRRRLYGLAYRMLGTVQDAEDLVQEVYLRFHQADLSNLRTPEAWLLTATSRLAIDRLRRLRLERSSYVGTWLAEPVQLSEPPDPEATAALASSASVAFLFLLDRLSPQERAAFLLHEVFERDYAEIAQILEKAESACRQIVHRAKERLKTDLPLRQTAAKNQKRLLQQFLTALREGDQTSLLRLISVNVQLLSDGGGKVPAARKVLSGADRVAHLLLTVERKWGYADQRTILTINGDAAIVATRKDLVYSATFIESDGERILRFYRLLNPDKLRAFQALTAQSRPPGESLGPSFRQWSL